MLRNYDSIVNVKLISNSKFWWKFELQGIDPNSNFCLIRSKTLPTNDFELTVPDL